MLSALDGRPLACVPPFRAQTITKIAHNFD
jgi:hypothetical protein